MDRYEKVVDHLIVVDKNIGSGVNGIVGTYRLLRQNVAENNDGFYTSDEYDIKPLIKSGANCLELGRSCVLSDYRTRPVVQLLWSGISTYVTDNNIGMLFGCASIPGINISDISMQLSYLYHYHMAPEEFCPVAVNDRYVEMNLHNKDDLNKRAVFTSLPPLFKGYLRIGSFVGNGAVIDHNFGTTDVCMILPTHNVTQRYKQHYERRNNSALPNQKNVKHTLATLSEDNG